MNLFYLPGATEGEVQLTAEESVHCVRVLRMKAGDEVLFTDGKGWFYKGVLSRADPRGCVADLTTRRRGDDAEGFGIHIAIGPTKQADRTEWFLEKATEIGIDEVSFFASEHSERRHVQLERLNRVVLSAMKQSLKSRLPILNPMVKFDELLRKPYNGQKFIAWIDDSKRENLYNMIRQGEKVMVLIGPEGDFSKNEVARAQSSGFLPVSLGTARLRTETAALAACMGFHVKNQLRTDL
jgi:16S rRNA (uracil1498-N3)-methyltransferase